MSDDTEVRAEFERQMQGRSLLRHRLRGTYSSVNIAALWNQHLRSVAWQASRTQPDTAVKDKCIAELELAVDDLAALVQRLVRAIHTANPSNTFADKAMDYLKRKGLQGNPLRADKT